MQDRTPKVSVIMAFHNAGPYFKDAIGSVLAQQLEQIELILSDDGATDGSRQVAEAAAAADPRVRLVSGPQSGPAVARNRALDVARGAHIAIVDADDLIHPARFAYMAAQLDALGAAMVADDLVHFGAETNRSLLKHLNLQATWWVDARALLAAEAGPPKTPLGYLKPLIRRDAIGDLRYRPELRVGEDFDFLLRLSLTGARLAVLPSAMYLYRRHSQSISHRLSVHDADAMVAALDDLICDPVTEPVADLIAARRTGLIEDAGFAQTVAHLKSRRWGRAVAQVLRQPKVLGRLGSAFAERRARSDAQQGAAQLILDRAPASLSEVLDLVASSNGGQTQIDVRGRGGLEALGYVPGWAQARLTPPQTGWTDAEKRQINALPWPVHMECD